MSKYAFPHANATEYGMLLRDYFAVHAPAPTLTKIQEQQTLDRTANPHNDSYKKPWRSTLEIEWELRYAWADAGIEASQKP